MTEDIELSKKNLKWLEDNAHSIMKRHMEGKITDEQALKEFKELNPPDRGFYWNPYHVINEEISKLETRVGSHEEG